MDPHPDKFPLPLEEPPRKHAAHGAHEETFTILYHVLFAVYQPHMQCKPVHLHPEIFVLFSMQSPVLRPALAEHRQTA